MRQPAYFRAVAPNSTPHRNQPSRAETSGSPADDRHRPKAPWHRAINSLLAMGRSGAVTLVLAAVLPACEPQMGVGYHGEPLATIRGVLTTGAQTSQTGLQVNAEMAILWSPAPEERQVDGTEEGPNTRLFLNRTSVQGRFPAGFALQLFTPLPRDAFIDVNGFAGDPLDVFEPSPEMAVGLMAVVEEGKLGDTDRLPTPSSFDALFDNEPAFDGLLAVNTDEVVVYVDTAPSPGSYIWLVFGELQRGYNLIRLPEETDIDLPSIDIMSPMPLEAYDIPDVYLDRFRFFYDEVLPGSGRPAQMSTSMTCSSITNLLVTP